MAETKLWHQDDDQLYQLRVTDETVYEESIASLPGFNIIGAGGSEDAKNYLDQGRNCPHCAGILKFIGITKGSFDKVYCADCKHQFYADDITENNKTVDGLYRRIPDSLVQHYTEYGRQRKRNQTK